LDSDAPGPHIKGDVIKVLQCEWDMVIAFPPCTDLAVSGARYFEQKRKDGRQQASILFFMAFAECNAEKYCIENPVGIMSSKWRKPNQIIQPWQFGHGETKATCLWLKNLPPLLPTEIVEGREQKVWRMPPSKDRAKLRSKTYQGIADAMAEQWG
jgi:site-specific DNA-cytosine methylase